MLGLQTGLNTRPVLCILHLRRINANYNLVAHLRSLRAQGLTKLRINEKSEIGICYCLRDYRLLAVGFIEVRLWHSHRTRKT